MPCPYEDCTNKDRCHLCIPEGRLHKTGSKVSKPLKRKDPLGKVAKYQKEGMALEDRVKKTFNSRTNTSPDRNHRLLRRSARATSGSGNLWSDPGDIITPDYLIECKERGTLNAKGEKTMSITKGMLDKIKEEAYFSQRVPLLAFSFKECDNVYVVIDYDVMLELIQTSHTLRDRILELEEERSGKSIE